MKSKHTPGPWGYAGNDMLKCDVYRKNTMPGEFYKVADVIRERDARLIAAAPELLECLIELANGHSIEREAKARAVIAKATGAAP